MMNKLTLNQIILYTLSILVLFMIPIYTIVTNNTALKDGTEYLFKVEAFDPYDMFRGNYLNISFKEDSVKGNILEQQNNSASEYYVTIGTRRDGFAYFTSISSIEPKNTTNYFKTSGYYRNYAKEYRIETPTRYYMNENKSISAEQIYRDNIDSTYVKVRVKNGKMVIVGVYVNDILIDSID